MGTYSRSLVGLCGLREHRLFRLGRAGAAAAEFAIITPMLLAPLGGAADLALAVARSTRLLGAARAAAEYATLAPNDTSNRAASLATSLISDFSGYSVTVTLSCECPGSVSSSSGTVVSCSSTCATGLAQFVTVTANAPFTPLFPFSSILPFESLGATSGRAVARIS